MSELERQIIELFRLLNSEQKQSFNEVVQSLAEENRRKGDMQ